MNDKRFKGMRFQQDIATNHTVLETLTVLNGFFSGCAISGFSDQYWSPRSYDFKLLFSEVKDLHQQAHDHPNIESRHLYHTVVENFSRSVSLYY